MNLVKSVETMKAKWLFVFKFCVWSTVITSACSLGLIFLKGTLNSLKDSSGALGPDLVSVIFFTDLFFFVLASFAGLYYCYLFAYKRNGTKFLKTYSWIWLIASSLSVLTSFSFSSAVGLALAIWFFRVSLDLIKSQKELLKGVEV